MFHSLGDFAERLAVVLSQRLRVSRRNFFQSAIAVSAATSAWIGFPELAVAQQLGPCPKSIDTGLQPLSFVGDSKKAAMGLLESQFTTICVGLCRVGACKANEQCKRKDDEREGVSVTEPVPGLFVATGTLKKCLCVCKR
jgi:hypothetical protein